MKSRVAVLKVKTESILDDVARVCALAEMRLALRAGTTTLLKGNLSSNRPLPASNTTPWQLEGIILALRNAGLDDISWVRSEPLPRATDQNGLLPILRRYGIAVPCGLGLEGMRWVEYRPRSTLHVLHRLFPAGIFLPDHFFGRNMVHLPTVRSSPVTTTTGAMVSSVGGLLGTRRHLALAELPRVLVDLLAIQREIHGGLFALMDGTTAGNGTFCRSPIPVVKDFLLASADPVAIDAVAAKMMGFEPLGLEFIRVAHEDGLGVGDPVDIEVVGDDISNQNWGFSPDENAASAGSGMFRPGAVRRFLFDTPLAPLLAAGSVLYHEHYRWPRQDKGAFDLWKTETDWGKLFTRYEQGPLER
jgi:uncharacterized protein (DUF362 family)